MSFGTYLLIGFICWALLSLLELKEDGWELSKWKQDWTFKHTSKVVAWLVVTLFFWPCVITIWLYERGFFKS